MAKKRKRRSRAGLIISLILSLVLIAVISLGLYWYMFANVKALPGQWSRNIDITNNTVVNITDYMREAAMGDEIDVASLVGQMNVKIILTVDKDGKWLQQVDFESYNNCERQAKNALKQAVEQLIKNRMEKSYIENDRSIEEMVKDTVGMSLDSYLDKYGPQIIVSYDSLQNEYNIDTNYEADRNTITFISVEGDKSYEYAVANGMLAVDYGTESVIYHKEVE